MDFTLEDINEISYRVPCLSKELASTWSAAVTASGVFPDTVNVIDSGSAGMVMGAAAMAAAKLAQEGASLEECHAAAVDTVKRGKTWASLAAAIAAAPMTMPAEPESITLTVSGNTADV